MRRRSDDLPAFGKPEERRVGDELQMQLEPVLLARLADLGRVGRAPPGRRVAAVPLPALAAAGHGDPRAGVGQVGDRLAGLAQAHLRADRHLDARGPRRRARASRSPGRARRAARGSGTRCETGERSRRSALGDEHDVAAVAAVAAVGAALRDVLLPPEADAAVAAAAALDLDRRAVGEHRRTPALRGLLGQHADVAAAVLAREGDRARRPSRRRCRRSPSPVPLPG